MLINLENTLWLHNVFFLNEILLSGNQKIHTKCIYLSISYLKVIVWHNLKMRLPKLFLRKI